MATLQYVAPFLAGVMVLAAVVDWFSPTDQLLLIAAIAVAMTLAILLLWSFFKPVTTWQAARTAERGLGERDALTTALEFSDPEEPLHNQIQRRADEVVARSKARDAIHFLTDRRRLRNAGALVAAALVIGLLPPLSSTPALSAGTKEALAAEAEELERIADAIEVADVEKGKEIASELRQLAKELRESNTSEEALEALDKTDKRLEANVDAKFLAQKAAAQGLARDLTLRPLAPGSLDSASQFEELAGLIDELSEQELNALEDRLQDLASSQAAGNPALSGQLSEAATAIGAGNLNGASEALRNAGSDQEAGIGAARGQQALAETLRALDGVRSRVSGAAAAGQGQGQGEGQGEGQGQGQGGGGQGGTPAGGGASGQISGVAPGAGGAAGQGGQGTVGSGAKGDYGTDVQTIFDPILEGNISDQIQVGINGGSGLGDIIGRGDAPTQRGESVVPYAQVLPNYLGEAADTLSSLQLPPSLRGIVQSYFNILSQQAQ